MKKEDKKSLVQELVEVLNQYNMVYFTCTAALDGVTDNLFRRACFNENIRVIVVKNSLLKKAMEQVSDKDYSEVKGALVGQTALLFTEIANAPAKLIKDFVTKMGKAPVLKAAYIEGASFVGIQHLPALASLKSREELVADVAALLQAPIRNVLSALENHSKQQEQEVTAE